MELPQTLMKKLRCKECNQHLKKFPIYSYQNNDYICGNCPIIEDMNPQRNLVYEELASQINFPCSNANCTMRLKPDELERHEQSCDYRMFYCPHGCLFQGFENEMKEHAETHVLSLTETDPVVLNISEEKQYVYTMESMNKFFVIQISITEMKFYCRAKLIGPANLASNYKFAVNLEFGNGADEKYDQLNVIPDNNEIGINTANSLKVSLLDKQPEEQLVCRFEFTMDKKCLPTLPRNSTFDNDLVACPYCFEIMSAPIVLCKRGHSICASCKDKYSECPTCHEVYLETRNFMLETIAMRIERACKYDPCPFIGNIDVIKEHLKTCEFAPYDCPLSSSESLCNFNGNFDTLAEHLKSVHFGNMVECSTLTIILIDNEAPTIFFAIRNNCVFKLIYKYYKDSLSFGVQYVGPRNESEKYMCQLNLEAPTGETLHLKFKCMPTSAHDYFGSQNTHFVELPRKLLIPYINEIDIVLDFNMLKFV